MKLTDPKPSSYIVSKSYHIHGPLGFTLAFPARPELPQGLPSLYHFLNCGLRGLWIFLYVLLWPCDLPYIRGMTVAAILTPTAELLNRMQKMGQISSDSHRYQRQLYVINRREEGSTATLLSRGFEDESFSACPSWPSSKCTFCLPHWTFILLYFCLSGGGGDLFSFCFHITINKNSPRLKQHSNSEVFTSRKSTDSIQFWHNLLEYTLRLEYSQTAGSAPRVPLCPNFSCQSSVGFPMLLTQWLKLEKGFLKTCRNAAQDTWKSSAPEKQERCFYIIWSHCL